MFSKCIDYAKRGYEFTRQMAGTGKEKVIEVALKVKAAIAIVPLLRKEDFRAYSAIIDDAFASGVIFAACHITTKSVHDSYGGTAAAAVVALSLIFPTVVYRKVSRQNAGLRNFAINGMQGALTAVAPAYPLVSIPLLTYVAAHPTNHLISRSYETFTTLDYFSSSAGAWAMHSSQTYLGNWLGSVITCCMTSFIPYAKYVSNRLALRLPKRDFFLVESSAELWQQPLADLMEPFPQRSIFTNPREALVAYHWGVNVLDREYKHRRMVDQLIHLDFSLRDSIKATLAPHLIPDIVRLVHSYAFSYRIINGPHKF